MSLLCERRGILTHPTFFPPPVCSRPVSFPETPYTASPAGVDKAPPYRQPSGSFSTPGSATYARYKPSPERSESLQIKESFQIKESSESWGSCFPRKCTYPISPLPFYEVSGSQQVIRGLAMPEQDSRWLISKLNFGCHFLDTFITCLSKTIRLPTWPFIYLSSPTPQD